MSEENADFGKKRRSIIIDIELQENNKKKTDSENNPSVQSGTSNEGFDEDLILNEVFEKNLINESNYNNTFSRMNWDKNDNKPSSPLYFTPPQSPTFREPITPRLNTYRRDCENFGCIKKCNLTMHGFLDNIILPNQHFFTIVRFYS